MQRKYISDKPVNILYPPVTIKKGDTIVLDAEMNKLTTYFVILIRKEPIKFQVTLQTWQKLADRSTPV